MRIAALLHLVNARAPVACWVLVHVGDEVYVVELSDGRRRFAGLGQLEKCP